jgi:hypothetical protein
MESRNSAKSYVVEKWTISRLCDNGKKRGPQNEGKSSDVIENKRRKNVSSEFCHDVNENRPLVALRDDVDEKEGFSCQRSPIKFQQSALDSWARPSRGEPTGLLIGGR